VHLVSDGIVPTGVAFQAQGGISCGVQLMLSA